MVAGCEEVASAVRPRIGGHRRGSTVTMRAAAAVALIAVCAASAYAAEPVELATFIGLERPAPSAELQYGTAASQVVDLFLPRGDGPHPVAILIHGGCWSVTTAGREQLRPMASELAQRGTAVWSIGYRRANETGGGYPGTFEDVGAAIDRLRAEASRYRLDLSRTVVVGHSAGGHLALWAAVRDRLAAGTRLYRVQPFIPGSVISLAGIGDLEAFAAIIPGLCGPGIIDRLVPSPGGARSYAEISPAALPPPSGQVVMISGSLDRLVPPAVARAYARAMERKQATSVALVDLPGAGHFDLVTPGTRAWEEVRTRIGASLSAAP
jgi:acetyl esterase/lipase